MKSIGTLVLILMLPFMHGNAEESKNFETKILEAKDELSKDPSRGDLMVSIANYYAWQSTFDSAMIYVNKAKVIKYLNDDLYETWLNILLWSNQYHELLKACDTVERNGYRNDGNLALKRMTSYNETHAYAEGVAFIQSGTNSKYLKTQSINDIYNNMLMKRNTNIISTYYSIDLFEENIPQHLASLGYSFQAGRHTMALRANYAKRFNHNDLQLESDLYYMLNKHMYMYLNFGFTINAYLFPQRRAGYEIYMPSTKYKMETSVGVRYLKYAASEVFIWTGHFEKYYAKNWFSFRPFYVVQSTEHNNLSMMGSYRYYGGNGFDYWGMELTYGNSPDDSYALTQNATFNQLEAYKCKLERNIMITRISDLKIGLGYSREEYRSNQYRNRFLIELGYRIRLR